MPKKPVSEQLQKHKIIDYNFNYKNINREDRAFILSLSFCYYMRLKSFEKR